MERKTILIVDDDAGVRSSLAAFLQRAGFEAPTVENGAQALDRIARDRPDLVLLDVVMPVLDGRETLRSLRRTGDWLPVILLTEVGEASERAMALEEGADDYLNKPFDPQELTARVRAVLRRSAPNKPPLTAAWLLNSGALELDRRSRRIRLAGKEIDLTPKARAVLEYLMTHPDELVDRDRLLDAVWGWEQAAATRAVDARIVEIRRALGEDADNPVFIETVPGIGYRFFAKVTGTA